MDINFADVHLDRFRNLKRQALDLGGTLQRLQDAAVGDAFGFADELQGDFDPDCPVQVDLVQVRVQYFAGYGSALQVFEDHVLAVEIRRARLEPDQPHVRGS